MDKKIKEIVKRVGQEEEVDEQAVKAALFIVTNYAREKMKKMEFPAILWPKLGSFNVIDNRCPEDNQETLKEFKTKFKREEL